MAKQKMGNQIVGIADNGELATEQGRKEEHVIKQKGKQLKRWQTTGRSFVYFLFLLGLGWVGSAVTFATLGNLD